MKAEWAPENIEDLMCYWLVTYANAYKAPASIRRDEGMIRHQILPYFGRLKIEEIKTRDIELWLLELRDRLGLCEKICNDALGLFRKVFNDGIRWGYVKDNPVARVRKYSIREQKYQYWKSFEVVRFLEFFEKFDTKPRAFWPTVLALYTGMRRGELVALKWDRIDLDARLITVDRAYCRVLKADKSYTKSGKVRYVPISSKLIRYLRVIRSLTTADNKVLPQSPIDMLQKDFVKLAKMCSNPGIKFHDLRHTFASNFLAGGGKIYDLKKILGHSTIQVTERYVHMVPEELKGKTEVLGF
ncbi:MAG: site-specific integrase [Deltaproteobacteria bacterium]|nr:site-specific integrase [Deltaproteobacteria bacterium]